MNSNWDLVPQENSLIAEGTASYLILESLETTRLQPKSLVLKKGGFHNHILLLFSTFFF